MILNTCPLLAFQRDSPPSLRYQHCSFFPFGSCDASSFPFFSSSYAVSKLRCLTFVDQPLVVWTHKSIFVPHFLDITDFPVYVTFYETQPRTNSTFALSWPSSAPLTIPNMSLVVVLCRSLSRFFCSACWEGIEILATG